MENVQKPQKSVPKRSFKHFPHSFPQACGKFPEKACGKLDFGYFHVFTKKTKNFGEKSLCFSPLSGKKPPHSKAEQGD